MTNLKQSFSIIYSIPSALVLTIAGVIVLYSSAFSAEIKQTFMITDSETGLPIDNVKIILNNESIKLTDSLGIADILKPQGNYKFTFRRVGYSEVNDIIEFSPENSFIRVYLKPDGVKSQNVIVTGHNYQNEIDKILDGNYSIEGNTLKRNYKQTIAESMTDMTGVTISSMGAATSKPVLRGMGGNRVEMQVNETLIADLSSSSSDHVISQEVTGATKIEVIRGVDALKRSSNSSTGIIKISGNQIPVEKFEKGKLQTIILGETVNNGFSASANGDYTYGNFGFHSEGTYRKFNNIHTPKGILDNSNGLADNFVFGSSYIGNDFVSGMSFTTQSNNYNVPGGVVGSHPNGANIDMIYRNINFRSLIHIHNDIFDNIDINLSRTYYHHYEYEYSGILGAEFKLTDYTASIDFSKKSRDLTENIDFGLNFNNKIHTFGAFVFTPNTNNTNFSAYYTHKIDLNNFVLQYGTRLHYANYEPEISLKNTETITGRDMFLVSGAFSLAYRTDFNSSFILHLGLNKRQPSVEELYSGGPHLASYTYEVGNSYLPQESSVSLELSFNQESDLANFFVTAYLYEYSSFISFRNSGDTNWAQFLPIFKSSSIKARIAGIEANFRIYIYRNLELFGGISFNYGQNLSENTPLPFFPPTLGNLGINYIHNGLGVGFKMRYSLEQSRIDKFENITPGFIVLGGFIEYKFQSGNYFNDITLAIDNLTNYEYYNHLSRIKQIIPEAGRNIRLIYRLLY